MTARRNGLTASGGNHEPETFDGQGNLLTPARLPKIDLRDAHAIRREMAAVYRDMRAGRIASQDGTRLAYVLDMIRKACETEALQDLAKYGDKTPLIPAPEFTHEELKAEAIARGLPSKIFED